MGYNRIADDSNRVDRPGTSERRGEPAKRAHSGINLAGSVAAKERNCQRSCILRFGSASSVQGRSFPGGRRSAFAL